MIDPNTHASMADDLYRAHQEIAALKKELEHSKTIIQEQIHYMSELSNLNLKMRNHIFYAMNFLDDIEERGSVKLDQAIEELRKAEALQGKVGGEPSASNWFCNKCGWAGIAEFSTTAQRLHDENNVCRYLIFPMKSEGEKR